MLFSPWKIHGGQPAEISLIFFWKLIAPLKHGRNSLKIRFELIGVFLKDGPHEKKFNEEKITITNFRTFGTSVKALQ